MLYMKACPRCHGDVHTDSDNFGAYARCLQCGFVRDLPERRQRQAEPAQITTYRPPPGDDDEEQEAYRRAV